MMALLKSLDLVHGGAGHNEAPNRPVRAQHRAESPPLPPHGPLSIAEIALSRQGPALVSAHKGLPDPFMVHMIKPDRIGLGDGDDVQVLGILHQGVKIGHEGGVTAVPVKGLLDHLAFSQRGRRGGQVPLDLILKAGQGQAHGQREGDPHQRQPYPRGPQQKLKENGGQVVPISLCW